MNNDIRNNWTKEEIQKIFSLPLLELISKANEMHRKHNVLGEVQVCKLLSVKTGGCPEDCAYCPQAARYSTDVDVHKLMDYDQVMKEATKAKEEGNTRFCMGAAWREVRDNKDFDRVLDMVKGVSGLNMEVCCTMGMITKEQAEKLKEAGLDAYNHNLDSGEEFYDEIITTRKYQDRLETLENVQKSKISLCSGGIIGMGESEEDRVSMIYTLATLPEQPESVPVNALIPIEGTPLEDQPVVPIWDVVRMIACARIVFPKARVRLSAGRIEMKPAEQALCFLAGANSVFSGEKLLTAPNNTSCSDKELFEILGLQPLLPKKQQKQELSKA